MVYITFLYSASNRLFLRYLSYDCNKHSFKWYFSLWIERHKSNYHLRFVFIVHSVSYIVLLDCNIHPHPMIAHFSPRRHIVWSRTEHERSFSPCHVIKITMHMKKKYEAHSILDKDIIKNVTIKHLSDYIKVVFLFFYIS